MQSEKLKQEKEDESVQAARARNLLRQIRQRHPRVDLNDETLDALAYIPAADASRLLEMAEQPGVPNPSAYIKLSLKRGYGA